MRSLLVVLWAVIPVAAHETITTSLTWSAEISRIVYNRCLPCHGPEKNIPLTSYEQARPWAKAMRDEVLSRRMPPWGAVKGYGSHKGDPSLTQDEIMRIAQWVEGGAPEGNPQHLPPLPEPLAPAPLPSGKWVRSAAPGYQVLAIRPLAAVPSAKITLRGADGAVQPLLWLYEYRGEWKRTFILEKPVHVRRGSRIVSEPPVPLMFLVRK